MADIEIFGKIKENIKPTSEWELENPILLKNEKGVEIVENSGFRVKVGDGSTSWGELSYIDNVLDISGLITTQTFNDINFWQKQDNLVFATISNGNELGAPEKIGTIMSIKSEYFISQLLYAQPTGKIYIRRGNAVVWYRDDITDNYWMDLCPNQNIINAEEPFGASHDFNTYTSEADIMITHEESNEYLNISDGIKSNLQNAKYIYLSVIPAQDSDIAQYLYVLYDDNGAINPLAFLRTKRGNTWSEWSSTESSSQIYPLKEELGGLGADNFNNGRQNLMDITHLVTPENYNDISFWRGNPGITICRSAQLNSKDPPFGYGLILTTVVNTEVSQVFFRQSSGEVLRRSGNENGWNADLNMLGKNAWKYIPVYEGRTMPVYDDYTQFSKSTYLYDIHEALPQYSIAYIVLNASHPIVTNATNKIPNAYCIIEIIRSGGRSTVILNAGNYGIGFWKATINATTKVIDWYLYTGTKV